VRKRTPGFTLGRWRGSLADVAEAVGAAPPAAPAGTVAATMPAGAAGPGAAALALPDKPSIAVLPFVNMSSDPEQEYFVDGMVEDLITKLSRLRWLFVIARNSSFTYKGQALDIRRVGRELGVRYVLEGSVRRGGNRVRVTAQLIEAESGHHVWADRYDRGVEDIFAVQDEIGDTISATLGPEISAAERERAARKPPESLDVWECYHRGMWHYAKVEAAETTRARGFFTRAVELEPEFAAAHAAIALTYFTETTVFRPPLMRRELIPHVAAHARRAIAADPANAIAHFALSSALMLSGRHPESIAEAEVAVGLDPNSAWSHGGRGGALAFGGRPSDAIEPLRTAMRLSPFDPIMPRWLHYLSRAHYWAGDYQRAAGVAGQLCQSYRNFAPGHRTLIAALGQTGHLDDAQTVMSDGLDRFGDDFRVVMLTCVDELRPIDHEHLLDGYRKAGVVN
jgi:adenylate cyclase